MEVTVSPPPLCAPGISAAGWGSVDASSLPQGMQNPDFWWMQIAPGWVEQQEERAGQDLLPEFPMPSLLWPCTELPCPCHAALPARAQVQCLFLDPFHLVFGADITVPGGNSCSSLGLTSDSTLRAVSWSLGMLLAGATPPETSWISGIPFSLCHLLSCRIFK